MNATRPIPVRNDPPPDTEGPHARLKLPPGLAYAQLRPEQRQRHQALMQASAGLERAALTFHPSSPTHQALRRQARDLRHHRHNPYPPSAEQADQRHGHYNLHLPYTLSAHLLRIHYPQAATSTLRRYFHPLAWPEYQHLSLPELLVIVLPALQAARPSAQNLTLGRWLNSEAQQRAAETLVWLMAEQHLSQLPSSLLLHPTKDEHRQRLDLQALSPAPNHTARAEEHTQ